MQQFLWFAWKSAIWLTRFQHSLSRSVCVCVCIRARLTHGTKNHLSHINKQVKYMQHICEHCKAAQTHTQRKKKKSKKLEQLFRQQTRVLKEFRSICRFHLISAVDSVANTIFKSHLEIDVTVKLRMSCTMKSMLKKRLTSKNSVANCAFELHCHQIIECEVFGKEKKNLYLIMILTHFSTSKILHVFFQWEMLHDFCVKEVPKNS